MEVLIDTREKQPWTFTSSRIHKLDTGDYSLPFLHNDVCIERKKTVSELAGNVTKKCFWREMERMSEFKHKVFVCEFAEGDIAPFPSGAGIPRYLRNKVRVKGPFILSCINRIRYEFNISVEFFLNRRMAELFAKNWLQELDDVYSKR